MPASGFFACLEILMGRKNRRRRDTFVPLDLTPEQIPKPPAPKMHPIGNGSYRRERFDEGRWRADRQREARTQRGIDWSVCLVPGCGKSLLLWGSNPHPEDRRDVSMELPLCYDHQAVVWRMCITYYADKPEFAERVADVNERIAAREQREADAEKHAFMQRQDGMLYFIRLGDLVKVGWTRDLRSRLKSYGASASLLVAYPGTRDDETTLHRQLRPALAKGREWYHDGDVINHFISEALEQYGPPPTFDDMWTQPKRIVAGKRVGRR